MLPATVKALSDTLDFTRRQVDRLRHGPNPYLQNNYAPVPRECAPTRVHVVAGAIPADLPPGVFLRNGPNPSHPVRGLYHWFDGDGMVHALSLDNGDMAYTSHQVRTVKLAYEDEVGGADSLNVGDLQGPLGLVKMGLFHARSRLGDDKIKKLLMLKFALLVHGAFILTIHKNFILYRRPADHHQTLFYDLG